MTDFQSIEKHNDRQVPMVVFKLQEKEYGIPVHATREIIKTTEFLEIPNCPDFISGVINLRGNIICVIDLRKQFNFAASKKSHQEEIMIVKIKSMLMGLMIDSVSEVLKIPLSDIEPVPKILSLQIPHHCLVGMGKYDNRIITLLNLENILSLHQLKELEINAGPSSI